MPHVTISEKIFRALEAEAKARGLTVEQLVEEILTEWLGVGAEQEKEITRRLRNWGYA
ncbi:MAG: ribbon-helix-helix protein, CopG family [Desulfurococcaceae archaeon]